MAAVQTQNEIPHLKIVDKLDGVPAIHDSVAYAHYLVNSTQATAGLYQVALGLATKSYDLAQPVLSRTKPILQTADGLAVATFDRAEATFPYPFKTPTQDLIVVKQSKAVYDARIAPLFQNAQPIITDVINRTAEINSALGARAYAVVQQSGEMSGALLEHLKQLAEQGKGLPSSLIESVGKVTGDVKKIVDSSLQDKSNKLGAYVVDNVKPVVDEIYSFVMGAKKRAEEEAKKAADKASETVDQASS